MSNVPKAVQSPTSRTWSSERRVDAAVVMDLRVDDRRLAVHREVGLPAVFVGDPSVTDGFTTVWTDDAAALDEAVGYLAGLGHLARSAPAPLPHHRPEQRTNC